MLKKNPMDRPKANQLLKDDFFCKNLKLSEPNNIFKIRKDG